MNNMALGDTPSVGFGLGLKVHVPDKSGQYLQEERYQTQRAAKAKASDDKTLDDLLKQARSIDKGKFHQVVLPDVENDVNNTIKDIYSLHQKNPNNYKPQAEEKLVDLVNKLRTHATRSESLYAADKAKADDLSPEGQQVQGLINESRGKGYDYFAKRLKETGVVDKSGGYVSAGDQGGITLRSRPKNYDIGDELLKKKKAYIQDFGTHLMGVSGNQEVFGKWQDIPDSPEDVVHLGSLAKKAGVDPSKIQFKTKDDILSEAWSDRNIQDQVRYEHRGENLSDADLKKKFKEEHRSDLGGSYKETTKTLPRPRKDQESKVEGNSWTMGDVTVTYNKSPVNGTVMVVPENNKKKLVERDWIDGEGNKFSGIISHTQQRQGELPVVHVNRVLTPDDGVSRIDKKTGSIIKKGQLTRKIKTKDGSIKTEPIETKDIYVRKNPSQKEVVDVEVPYVDAVNKANATADNGNRSFEEVVGKFEGKADKKSAAPAKSGGKMSQDDWNKKWSTLKKGDTLEGLDGKTYTKK